MLMQRIQAVLASLALALFASGAFAQAYPSKPVRVIVPFSAGGLSDVLARGIGQELSERPSPKGEGFSLRLKPVTVGLAADGPM